MSPGIAFAIAMLGFPGDVKPDSSAAAPMFESDVAPILRAYCWKCHGGEGREAGLDMRSLPLLLAGGKSGPAVSAGSPEKSSLFQKLSAGKMPPGSELKPTAEHLATIKKWIEAGAPARYRGDSPRPAGAIVKERPWWAARLVRKPAIPAGKFDSPIDAFLADSAPGAHEADRRTLARRVHFDLIGLPPTPEEVEAFENDRAPDAYERLIDRLLASPSYGERWGRHWLDAAGYVDAIGTDNDATIIEERERIWKYRDYVIRAINEDKPFDRFLLEQIAGDELVDWRNAKTFTPEIRELLTATGFLRQAADVTYAPELNTADIRNQVLFDTVQIVASNVLGLTIHCAQCHDHKFDPISQAEYYRLAAFFTPAYDPQNWKHSKDRFLADVSPSEKAAADSHNAEIDRKTADLRKRVETSRAPFERRLVDAKLSKLPEPIRADVKLAVDTPADKRDAVRKYLAEKLGPLIKVTPGEVDQALDAPARRIAAESSGEIARLEKTRKTYDKIQALWDLGPPPKTYLYRRGDFRTPGPEVAPGVPEILDDPAKPFANAGGAVGGRTALARWLTAPDHPLTSRVFVNRVWQQYFGEGIVATPDNFGKSGAAPVRPELLDWLAREFVESGWSLKRLHRAILRSAAYRQVSTGDASGRMPLRRLEAEAVRDAVLSVSGSLDRRPQGPPIPLKAHPDGRVTIDDEKAPAGSRFRRSLYVFNRRNYHLTDLNLFDQPAVAHNCAKRDRAALVSQSLAMLNGPLSMEESVRFAERVRREAGGDRDRRVERAFRLALGRLPDQEERVESRGFLVKQAAAHRETSKLPESAADEAALANLCHMLLNTNEFLYIP